MPTPSNRTPIRIARGLKVDLDASLADLEEGEIAWAEDLNQLFVVEGTGAAAVLVAATGPGVASSVVGGMVPGNGVAANPALEITTIDTGVF